jgi:hypothetical protein
LRYMLLVYTDEVLSEQRSQEAWNEVIAGHVSVKDEAAKKGILRGASPLKPSSTATTLRLQNDEVVIVDGPFAETKEQLVGYYFLDCENLDEAIEWGKKFVSACGPFGDCFEIRPLEDHSQIAPECDDGNS